MYVHSSWDLSMFSSRPTRTKFLMWNIALIHPPVMRSEWSVWPKWRYLLIIHSLPIARSPWTVPIPACTSTDELAICNATPAGMSNSHALLCFLHNQRDVTAKLKILEIFQPLTNKICHEIYAKDSVLLWSDSKDQLDERAEIHL